MEDFQAPRRRRTLFAVLAVVVLALAAGWAYFHFTRGSDAAVQTTQASRANAKSGKGGSDPNRATPVVAGVAAIGDVNVYLGGLGTVIPLRTVSVRSRVDGELMKIHFTEGQTVKAGDLLAEIDPRPFEVQLSQAQGQLVKDQSLLANARIDLERYRTLFAQDS